MDDIVTRLYIEASVPKYLCTPLGLTAMDAAKQIGRLQAANEALRAAHHEAMGLDTCIPTADVAMQDEWRVPGRG